MSRCVEATPVLSVLLLLTAFAPPASATSCDHPLPETLDVEEITSASSHGRYAHLAGVAATTIVPAGDLDGDSYADFLVGHTGHTHGVNPEVGRLYTAYGDASGLAGDLNMRNCSSNWPSGKGSAASGPLEDYANLGAAVVVGDFEGDGSPDVVVSAGGFHTDTGRIYFIPDHVPNHATNQAITMEAEVVLEPTLHADGEELGLFGASLAAGDLNNDGYDDLIVGSKGTQYALSDEDRNYC